MIIIFVLELHLVIMVLLIFIKHIQINFKRKMAEYLKDAPELVAKINDGTYTRKHVEAIVNEYNTLKSSL